MKIYRPVVGHAPPTTVTQPSILLYTLWRSGTHWLSEMMSDLTGLISLYTSDEITDYAAETAAQLRQYSTNTILIRHICTQPREMLCLTAPLRMRIIFLFRDPRDVIASNINMRKHREGYRPHLPPFPDMNVDEILAWELANLGDLYRRLLPAWAAAEHDDLLKVRYEDLLADTVGELGRVAHFLGLAVGSEQIARIAQAHDFQRKTARRAGEEDKQAHQRKGIVGDHRNQFSAEQLRRIHEALGDTVERLGYQP